MKHSLPAFFLFFVIFLSCHNPNDSPESKLKAKLYPNEDHFFDKQYPAKEFNFSSYLDALRKVQIFKNHSANRSNGKWITEGPGNIGARINTVAVHPTNSDIILAGFSEGGIFKTTNGGKDWYPVFDDQIKLSIGDITFDEKNPNIIYAGTGDPNISGYPFVGNGIFKSFDMGESWIYLGLSEVGIISQIRISPTNSDVLYVGAMGIPFIKNQNRGLYKSVNGGLSWDKILFVNDSTGIIDLAIHPQNENIVYATGWNRIRNNFKSMVSGPDAKIFKTTDGGAQWEILSSGLPQTAFSRIGIDISKSNPDILYASYTNPVTYNLDAIFKTNDAGQTWESLPIYGEGLTNLPKSLYGGFGWYFGKVRVNPKNPNDIFILGVDLYRSLDGGSNWTLAVPPWWTYEVHADKHDLVFTGSDILLATDGGLYKSKVASTDYWEDIENIPATQFYRVAYNPHRPDFFYGGAQDNGSTGGNASQINLWDRIYGGDGFQMAFNPDNPSVFYASSQNGNIVVTQDGGITFSNGTAGINSSDSRNWDMPYMISAHQSDRLYAGTDKIYRSSDVIVPAWNPISPVLTNPNSTALRKNISTLHESPLNQDYLYAGTTDGMLWHSDDYGETWENITSGLPNRYITSVFASPDHENTVFVSFSGYRDFDNNPYIFVSEDSGKNWVSIQGNMPQIAINSILVLPGYQSNVIFVATDAGVFYTKDRGKNWQIVGDNLPPVAVYHLTFNPASQLLVAGTYGRSIQSFDIRQLSLTSSLNKPLLKFDFSITPTLVQDKIQLNLNDNFVSVPESGFIMNESGIIVKKWSVSPGVTDLDVSTFPPGNYYVTMYSKTGITTRKFQKVR